MQIIYVQETKSDTTAINQVSLTVGIDLRSGQGIDGVDEQRRQLEIMLNMNIRGLPETHYDIFWDHIFRELGVFPNGYPLDAYEQGEFGDHPARFIANSGVLEITVCAASQEVARQHMLQILTAMVDEFWHTVARHFYNETECKNLKYHFRQVLNERAVNEQKIQQRPNYAETPAETLATWATTIEPADSITIEQKHKADTSALAITNITAGIEYTHLSNYVPSDSDPEEDEQPPKKDITRRALFSERQGAGQGETASWIPPTNGEVINFSAAALDQLATSEGAAASQQLNRKRPSSSINVAGTHYSYPANNSQRSPWSNLTKEGYFSFLRSGGDNLQRFCRANKFILSDDINFQMTLFEWQSEFKESQEQAPAPQPETKDEVKATDWDARLAALMGSGMSFENAQQRITLEKQAAEQGIPLKEVLNRYQAMAPQSAPSASHDKRDLLIRDIMHWGVEKDTATSIANAVTSNDEMLPYLLLSLRDEISKKVQSIINKYQQQEKQAADEEYKDRGNMELQPDFCPDFDDEERYGGAWGSDGEEDDSVIGYWNWRYDDLMKKYNNDEIVALQIILEQHAGANPEQVGISADYRFESFCRSITLNTMRAVWQAIKGENDCIGDKKLDSLSGETVYQTYLQCVSQSEAKVGTPTAVNPAHMFANASNRGRSASVNSNDSTNTLVGSPPSSPGYPA